MTTYNAVDGYKGSASMGGYTAPPKAPAYKPTYSDAYGIGGKKGKSESKKPADPRPAGVVATHPTQQPPQQEPKPSSGAGRKISTPMMAKEPEERDQMTPVGTPEPQSRGHSRSQSLGSVRPESRQAERVPPVVAAAPLAVPPTEKRSHSTGDIKGEEKNEKEKKDNKLYKAKDYNGQSGMYHSNNMGIYDSKHKYEHAKPYQGKNDYDLTHANAYGFNHSIDKNRGEKQKKPPPLEQKDKNSAVVAGAAVVHSEKPPVDNEATKKGKSQQQPAKQPEYHPPAAPPPPAPAHQPAYGDAYGLGGKKGHGQAKKLEEKEKEQKAKKKKVPTATLR